MTKEIIKNIYYDTKINEDFFIIKDANKLENNSKLILANFEFADVYDGYNYGYTKLDFGNHICLMFVNEHGFRLDVMILNAEKGLNSNVIKYLSENVDNEICAEILSVVEGFCEDYEDSFETFDIEEFEKHGVFE